MKTIIHQILPHSKALVLTLLFAVPLAASASPTVVGPYALTTFAFGPVGATKPDCITVDPSGHVWVSFANGVAPDGTDGKYSTVVEYSSKGSLLHTYPILGSNDGLKYNPYDRTIWALRNQDGNPALTVIDPHTQTTKDYTYSSVPAHGGGFDDVVFRNGQIYISASNPTLDTNGFNPAPSILSVTISGTTLQTTPVLSGDAYAINGVTGLPVKTVQTDPDSFTVDRLGNLVLDSQADAILLFVSHPGTYAQNVLELPLTDAVGNPVQVDDTVFPNTRKGTIYFTDTGANIVYALTSGSFDTTAGYSCSGPSVGTVDLSTGVYVPVVTGLNGSHGAVFVQTDEDDDGGHNHSDHN
jgi:hypothetical protein